ncbi:MAG: HesA/MoeB/ThiF family protein [Gammaproteobacteria bacterium]
MRDDLLNRYSRHIMLDDIGISGQENINRAKVLIIGAGGLASPVALYLAAAGIGHLTICDDDNIDETNLQRQILYATDDIGKSKSTTAAATMRRINPHIQTRAIGEKFDDANAAKLAAAADIIIDASDNYATRHLANRAVRRAKTPLIFGAAMATEGQVSVFDGRDKNAPCYNCLYSESDKAEETRCALMGVFSPLVGIVGAVMAAEALKLIAMPQAPTLAGRLLLIDARAMQIREIKLPQDPKCPVCNDNRR